MKKSLIVLFVLLLSVSLFAQQRTGNILGKVTDQEGTALPGVTVTLGSSYMGAITSITSELGTFRFPSLPPGDEYSLTAELTGFKKQVKTGVIVGVGQNSEVNLVMEMGKLEEEVTVLAVTPTVDAKKTSVGKNVTQEILQSLPSARDPWQVMQMAPAILMDRENVGGNESGQQASYTSKGDASGYNNNVWAVDGLVVTDPAAIGASPGYWDFDAFEEMNISTGGNDVTIQTGGVALNMVTRRGGNKVSLGGRFYYTDEAFQMDNLTDELKAEGVTTVNKITYIRDYGFNLGGPVIKDKVWVWGSYGVQDISTFALTGALVKPTLNNYNFKLNLQLIPQNRFEVFLAAGEKKFIGRGASQTRPTGYDQAGGYHFGSPILKIQDEHMFGDNLLLSLKFGFMDAAFQMIAHDDPDINMLTLYNQTTDVWNSISYYVTTRPMYNYNAYINYFNDNLFGVSHDIKLGVEYSTRRVTSDSCYAGGGYMIYNMNTAVLDWDGDGEAEVNPGLSQFWAYQQSYTDTSVNQLSLFFQDTITVGRFNFLLGVRYDRQNPVINAFTMNTIDGSNPAISETFDAETIAILNDFFRPADVPAMTPDYAWDVISPRIGITYDIFGTGKTVFKLNFAQYGDFMGTGSASYLYQNYIGASGWGSWLGFNWMDLNSNGIVNSNELYWGDPSTQAPQQMIVGGQIDPNLIDLQYGNYWAGFTPFQAIGDPIYTVDTSAGSSRTTEYLAVLEHELLTDFSLGLNFTYRHYDNISADIPYYPDTQHVRGKDDFVVAGQIPTSITYLKNGVPTQVNLGQGGGKDYYLLDPQWDYTDFVTHVPIDDYYGFWGIDFVFNKRLSNNWMLDGSVSYMDQWRHYGDNGLYEGATITNQWAFQDELWAPALGGASGKINQSLFSPWMVKLEGLYQLPLGFNISFTFNARAGHPIPHYINIVDYNWENYYQYSLTAVYLDKLGTTTLPVFYQLNLRLEKMIKISDSGRIYLMADAFNVFNSAIINRRYDERVGTYYTASGKFSPYANNFRINEILNPFIVRFGVRFQI